MRPSTVYLSLLLSFAPALASAEECLRFTGLGPAFAAELSLDAKTARVRFTPVNLALESAAERPAYVLADEESCGIRGDCDSVLYLGDEKGCYRDVLSFRGKWKGVDRKKGRELASVRLESRVEGESSVGAKAELRIERVARRFEYAPKANRYEEIEK